MILIAAGSSLPFCGHDSQQIVLRAFRALGRIATLRRVSSLYESPAWPDPADPPFVNAAAVIDTAMAPEALLAALHAIEAGFGRRRTVRNAPRTLDLDLLAYHELVSCEPALKVPHPRLTERAFVLVPLEEIAPDWAHPVSGETVEAMLSRVGPGAVRRIRQK